MMKFEQRYSNEPLGNLVHIIEHAGDYQPQTKFLTVTYVVDH